MLKFILKLIQNISCFVLFLFDRIWRTICVWGQLKAKNQNDLSFRNTLLGLFFKGDNIIKVEKDKLYNIDTNELIYAYPSGVVVGKEGYQLLVTEVQFAEFLIKSNFWELLKKLCFLEKNNIKLLSFHSFTKIKDRLNFLLLPIGCISEAEQCGYGRRIADYFFISVTKFLQLNNHNIDYLTSDKKINEGWKKTSLPGLLF